MLYENMLQLVKAFVYVVPVDDPLGPAVMSLFLDDCPLPTRLVHVLRMEVLLHLTQNGDFRQILSSTFIYKPILIKTFHKC